MPEPLREEPTRTARDFWDRGPWRPFSRLEQVALAGSLILICWLVFDAFMLERVRFLDPDARAFFHFVTSLGKSGALLAATVLLTIAIVSFRRRIENQPRSALPWIRDALGFLFLSVAGSGAIAFLIKNILGRARTKYYEVVGPIEFKVMGFDSEFASFPSGQATVIFAMTAVIALLVPRGRLPIFLLGTWIAGGRVLIGSHYLSDVIAAALVGIVFTYWLASRYAARGVLFAHLPDGRILLRRTRVPEYIAERAPLYEP